LQNPLTVSAIEKLPAGRREYDLPNAQFVKRGKCWSTLNPLVMTHFAVQER
jgi:hypothetical protein